MISFQSSQGTVDMPISDPVRVRASLYYREACPRHDAFYFFGPGQLLTGWLEPFSEPVRYRASLLPGQYQYLFELVNYVQYTLAGVETADGPNSFTVNTYTPKNLAQTTITELPANNTAKVTLTEVRFSRGYS